MLVGNNSVVFHQRFLPFGGTRTSIGSPQWLVEIAAEGRPF
ncbi:MAG: hypothetical protein OT477_02540 [Chloroflexi bacterium]|nr:hypothetical protein [Chloroflexota bacterium]